MRAGKHRQQRDCQRLVPVVALRCPRRSLESLLAALRLGLFPSSASA